MIEKQQFAQLEKQSAKSFNDQKALIKKIFAGRAIKCEKCQQLIQFVAAKGELPARIACAKNCTDIYLDIVE